MEEPESAFGPLGAFEEPLFFIEADRVDAQAGLL